MNYIQMEKLNTNIMGCTIEPRNNNNRKGEAGKTRKLKEKEGFETKL